ncbi:MAG: hypothetical protein KBF12_10230 [Sebaldella sp.]|mgnify:FL=1|nr:hypothetical protein [Sebaldella sp.]
MKQDDVILTEQFILDTETGVCHNSKNLESNCRIENLSPKNLFYSNYLYDEIKRHPSYKEKCEYCME